MTRPTLTIALATCNGAKFLERQLASYLSQTLPPFELVVGDDQSTDGTLGIIESFAAAAPFPVRLIRNDRRLGYGANFINVCRHARGDLIALSDQDDIWLPRKLELGAGPFADPGIVFSAHPVDLIDASDQPVGEFPQGIFDNAILPSGGLLAWGMYFGFTTLVRRAALLPFLDRFPEGAEPSDHGGHAHDRWIYFLADSVGASAIVNSPLALYRQHGVNLYGARKKDYLGSLSKPLAQILSRSLAYEQVARDRSRMLREHRLASTETGWLERLDASAERWEKIANNLSRRSAVYQAESVVRRALLWSGCVRDKVYASPHGRDHFNRFSVEDFLAIFKRAD